MRAVAVFVALAAACAAVRAAESGELDVARQALRDGLWEVARAHAAKDGSETAKLVILESWASEGKWDMVKSALAEWGDANPSPAFGYYRAVVDGRLEDAVTVLRLNGSAAGAAEARMLEADLRTREGKTAEAEKLWREVAAMTNAGERAFAVACANLGDVALLREAYARTRSLALRRMTGLRLGQALLKTPDGREEGAKLVRAVVADSPDAPGAREAFIALASHEAAAGRWKEAEKLYRDAMEIWPDAVRDAAVRQGLGSTLLKLGRAEEALKTFAEAETLAGDDSARALAALGRGDALSALGRADEATAEYKRVIDSFPETGVAKRLKKAVALRELESRGRALFKDYRYDEAKSAFAEVAAADPALKPRMDYCEMLCLFGLGDEEAAVRNAEALSKSSPDGGVRADATLWLAKVAYNRREWKRAAALFRSYAEAAPSGAAAPSALLQATRAAFAGNDFHLAIQTAAALEKAHPGSPAALDARLEQGRSLIELGRFDEAVLVLDRVAGAESASQELRQKAQILKADALFAMGADNPARYRSALETYRSAVLGGGLGRDERILAAFKIGRTLEKLKLHNEAVDQYYTHVVLAYRNGRIRGEHYGEEARAAFSRAAFRLADEAESRGNDNRAEDVLRLVVESDVPAAEEARRRIERILAKGRLL